MDRRVQWVSGELRDRRAPNGSRVRKGRAGLMARRDRRDHKAPRVRKGRKDRLVPPDTA